MEMEIEDKDVFALKYDFTKSEVLSLAKFLRKNEEKLPAGLESFYHVLEDSIYDLFSLDEANRFYS